MKLRVLLFGLIFLPLIATATEEKHGEMPAAEKPAEHGGEHGSEHKAPPAPSKGTPVGDVYNLAAVAEWRKTIESRGGQLLVWGEYLTSINGQNYSRVAVGPKSRGNTQVWKHFCVPQAGGDILVVSESADPAGDATYIPYDEWVGKCKPTGTSGGSC